MKSKIQKPILISLIIILAIAGVVGGLVFFTHNNDLSQNNTPVNSTPPHSTQNRLTTSTTAGLMPTII